MIYPLLGFWLLSALILLYEQKVGRIIIYFGIYSLITAAVLLLMAAPDVAMAEIAIGAFSTIFFVIVAEKYYSLAYQTDLSQEDELRTEGSTNYKKESKFKNSVLPLVFVLMIFGLVLYFAPGNDPSTLLKEQYIDLFMIEMGGENAVTAIYLGYRVYDTIFEALVLVVAVVAVLHMSFYDRPMVSEGIHSDINRSGIAIFIIKIISPIILLFGIYLIVNGFLTPGGGFQGGVAIATFFICRYLIYNIFDLPIGKILRMEKLVFVSIVLFAIAGVFIGLVDHAPPYLMTFVQNFYLVILNALIGIKVACGFTLLFYRYVSIERLEAE